MRLRLAQHGERRAGVVRDLPLRRLRLLLRRHRPRSQQLLAAPRLLRVPLRVARCLRPQLLQPGGLELRGLALFLLLRLSASQLSAQLPLLRR